jgi:hypothetical protein
VFEVTQSHRKPSFAREERFVTAIGRIGVEMMGLMGSFGLPPFATFPVVLYASWAASFTVICSYHLWKNGAH